MKASPGFVLVNALVLVAALAALAVLLLARAEGGRQRLAGGIDAEQLTLNLDAFEALALARIARDDGHVDHADEAWAAPAATLRLDRGSVAGRIIDQQGRFNLNWLAGGTGGGMDGFRSDAFDRLCARLGVSSSANAALRAFLRPGGPAEPGAYLLADPPSAPLGGSLLMVSQLRAVPGLPPRALARLAPHIAALDGASRLNINTATPQVLAAMLPTLSQPAIDRLISARSANPYTAVDAFLIDVGLARAGDEQQADDTPEQLSEDMISVRSDWFLALIDARIDTRSATRELLIERRALSEGPRIAWRVTVRP
ncbi:type II secretion system minor pseudopilin GspK [Salipiger aestuarii]|uniref:type II secretion system minor pseudopilin GspK n=1 Tax=Salipiger aestuarii TaxID=568098 RepID=UPI00123961BA|nr:type II secretion system minor pseudopilin GspK [Salipiger aestuarii]KAA8609008.1 hypothetical protein AL037_15885 [Salipiger aestuarii]